MKKGIVVILALAMVFCLSTFASAAQNVGNTSQKGSVLIFPKIVVKEGYDTLILMSNDYQKAVSVQCVWVTEKQDVQNFGFTMTKRQPVKFSAKTGYGTVNVNPFPWSKNGVGELKCWAVDRSGANQISWNHLWGNAKIINYEEGTAWEYNSWNFTARDVDRGDKVGTGGRIELSGESGEYDGCPKYLLFNFIPPRTKIHDVMFWDTDLTIVPCKQDVRENDRKPTYTMLKIDIWSEDEVKFSDEGVCIKCWYEEWISKISGNFRASQLKSHVARARVIGRKSTDCDHYWEETDDCEVCGTVETVNTGLVGTVQELMKIYDETDAVAVETDAVAVEAVPGQSPYRHFTAGTTLNGAGTATGSYAGYIEWEAEPLDEETPEGVRR